MSTLSSIFFRVTNNSILNRMLISLGIDGFMTEKFGMYKRVIPDKNLSAQEMAGFSRKQEVQEAINKTHADVQETARQHVKPGGHVLDIGCGDGNFSNYISTEHYVGLELSGAAAAEARARHLTVFSQTVEEYSRRHPAS